MTLKFIFCFLIKTVFVFAAPKIPVGAKSPADLDFKFLEKVDAWYGPKATAAVKEMFTASALYMDKAFPKCNSRSPIRQNKFTKCYTPGAVQFMKIIPDYLRPKDCSPPLDGLAELVNQVVEEWETDVVDKIITKRVKECGYTCKTRAACCGNTNMFVRQGFTIEPCHKQPCRVSALSSKEMRLVNASASCNLAQVGFADWKAVIEATHLLGDEFGELNERILCTVFGTRTPRMNCIKNHSEIGKCICCCHSYTPVLDRSSGKYTCAYKKDRTCDY